MCPRLKDDDNDEGGGEDVELDNELDVDGGGDTFLMRFAVPNDDDDGGEEVEADFSLTGDNPCIKVDHGAICFAISEAAALLAAVALLTVTAFASELALLELPRLCAYGLRELMEEAPLARRVLFNGLSATLRCSCCGCTALPFALAVAVVVPPSAAALAWAPVVAEDTTEDNIEPVIEGEGEAPPFNGVAFGVLPGVAWRSRMLMSNARSFVAASRMEMTPIVCCMISSVSIILIKETKKEKKNRKKTNLHHLHTPPWAAPSTAAPRQDACGFFAV